MSLLLEDGTSLLLEDGTSLLLEDGSGSVATTIGVPPLKTSLREVVLVAPTNESLEVDVYCAATPVATAPAFAVTTEGTVVTGAATYYSGSWSTSYGSDGWTTARTPTFGSAGSINVTTGDRLWLWVKAVAGSETAVWRVGSVIVL